MDLLSLLPPWLPPLLSAPFVGSFLGVLIRRLPVDAPVVLARSRCDGCSAVLRARDLVPLASYVLLRGRCSRCGHAIGPFYPAIELAALLVAAWAGWADPSDVWADCVLGWGLLALAWIDWEHMRLPDALTLPLIPLGLVLAWQDDPVVAMDHALAAMLGYVTFRSINWAYHRLRRADGLGQGDAKLMGVAGAWLGLAAMPAVLVGGALAGLVVGLALSVLTHRRIDTRRPIPFGPSLALAIWLVRLHGQTFGI